MWKTENRQGMPNSPFLTAPAKHTYIYTYMYIYIIYIYICIRRAIVLCSQTPPADSHSYGNRHHVFRAFTDGECEIPDTLLCVKRRFNAQEETLTLSGTQRHLGGPLYTNKLQKKCMCCGLPKPNCQTAGFGYIFPGWCYLYVYGQELYS